MKPASAKLVIYQVMTRLFGNKVSLNKPYGTLQENGVGKFSHFTPKALSGIKELGVTHIWYTGVIEHASLTAYPEAGIAADVPEVVKGRAGSPYTIRDYYDVDPDLAVNVSKRMQEFEDLVQRTHDAGLGVIIDFIPNHVARRYRSDARPDGVSDLGTGDDTTKSFLPSNNFYYLPGQSFRAPQEHVKRMKVVFPDLTESFDETPAKATGDDKFLATPPFDSWFEAAKLNYGVDYQGGKKSYFDPVPDTWVKMKDILVYWAQKKVDGFRCDMAEMVPVEFWNWAIPQVKAVNPDILFIAEIYKPSLYKDYIDRGRFDFLYDKVQLYDTLRLLVNGRAAAHDIGEIYKSQEGLHDRLLHFLENHDEQRIASPYFAGDPLKALPAMLLSATIDSGPIMIYFGQEVGEPGEDEEGFGPRDGRTTIYDYWGVPEHQKWMNLGAFDGGLLSSDQKELRAAYQVMLQAVRNEPAIREGAFADLTAYQLSMRTTSDRIVSFARFTASERVIVIAGFNQRTESVRLELPPELADSWQIKRGVPVDFIDLLGDTARFQLRETGFNITLPPYGMKMLKWSSENPKGK
jgi:glycosidase